MKPSEAADVLAFAALMDKRIIGPEDAMAWADILDGLDPKDCIEAIRRHHRNSTAYLLPNHIRVIVRAMITERQDLAAARRGLSKGRRPPGLASRDVEAIKRELAEKRAARESSDPVPAHRSESA